jgi:hypothetical protein
MLESSKSRREARMRLRTELNDILAKQVRDDPVWKAMIERGGVVGITGPTEETLGAMINATTSCCEALLVMVMRVADAVDDLAESVAALDALTYARRGVSRIALVAYQAARVVP